MTIKLGIHFCNDDGERFFGKGPYQLLCGIRELGSLRAAALHIGMAYTKAFKLMKQAEEAFGFSLTTRTIGGPGGGGSVLTEPAKELLMRYEAYETACGQMADNLYHTHFSTFRPQKSAADRQ